MNEVILSYKRVIEINPDHAQACFSLGAIYAELGQSDLAIAACEQAIKVAPDYVDPYCILAGVFITLKRFQEDADAFKEAFRIDPYCSLARGTLSKWFAQLGEKEAALEQYEILKTLDIVIADELLSKIRKIP